MLGYMMPSSIVSDERFADIWNDSISVAEAAARSLMTERGARLRAKRLRKRRVCLKHLRNHKAIAYKEGMYDEKIRQQYESKSKKLAREVFVRLDALQERAQLGLPLFD